MSAQSAEYLSRPVKVMTGAEFMGQFEVQRLSPTLIHQIWTRYDLDLSGDLDKDEINLMMQDVMEFKNGHRNVSEQVSQAVFRSIDTNSDGSISWEEFKAAMSTYGVGYDDVWVVKPMVKEQVEKKKWIPGVTG